MVLPANHLSAVSCLSGEMRPILDLRRLRRLRRYVRQNDWFQCLLFGYSLAPHTFSKCVEESLEPLRRQEKGILVYLDDLLILSRSGVRTDIVSAAAYVKRQGGGAHSSALHQAAVQPALAVGSLEWT